MSGVKKAKEATPGSSVSPRVDASSPGGFWRTPCSYQFAVADLFPGAMELLVLATLNGTPMHAYALSKALRLRSREQILIDDTSLYPLLNRLLRAKLLEAEWMQSGEGRKCKVYRITSAGVGTVRDLSDRYSQMVELMSGMLMDHSAEEAADEVHTPK